jgi:hypothetical protein
VKLVLLHSPLTGSAVWRKLALLLSERGHEVRVPDYRDVLAGPPPYYEKITHKAGREAGEASALIAHSGAGALVPSLVDTAAQRITSVVFVDALLPHPGKCWFDTVPQPMAAKLRSLEAGGWLPPWDRWWPKQVLEEMLPDSTARTIFVDDLPSLPLDFLKEKAPDIGLQSRLSCAYLQLSSGYDAEAGEAKARNWPVRTLNMDHLAMMTRTGEVAEALQGLLQAAG